jgi:hypothetical protein
MIKSDAPEQLYRVTEEDLLYGPGVTRTPEHGEVPFTESSRTPPGQGLTVPAGRPATIVR